MIMAPFCKNQHDNDRWGSMGLMAPNATAPKAKRPKAPDANSHRVPPHLGISMLWRGFCRTAGFAATLMVALLLACALVLPAWGSELASPDPQQPGFGAQPTQKSLSASTHALVPHRTSPVSVLSFTDTHPIGLSSREHVYVLPDLSSICAMAVSGGEDTDDVTDDMKGSHSRLASVDQNLGAELFLVRNDVSDSLEFPMCSSEGFALSFESSGDTYHYVEKFGDTVLAKKQPRDHRDTPPLVNPSPLNSPPGSGASQPPAKPQHPSSPSHFSSRWDHGDSY